MKSFLMAALLAPVLAPAAVRAATGGEPQALPPGGAAVLMWTPEQQAWGYKNMERIGPVHIIKRGARVKPLPQAAVQIDPAFTAGTKTYDTARYMSEFRASGVLVLKDGKIILERYGLGRSPHDRWTSFSVAKSVTSTLIGAAIQDGKIKSLDDAVTLYIPQLKGSAYEGVSVRQLITMTSGVKWNEDYADPNSDVAKVGLSILEPGINPVVSYMRRLPREAPPGTHFVYKTGETDLAGILLSNAVGESLAEYLSRKIWQPYGMEQDGVWVEDVAGHERGGCCISMTLRDYGRFALFTLGSGKAGGVPVLPAGWMQDATRPHVTTPPYGYFWWLAPEGYEAEGIFGQTVSVFPGDKLVVVINSAWPVAWSEDINKMRMQYLEAIRSSARSL